MKLKPCQYAYDTEDSCCINCDGLSIKNDKGEVFSATKCKGYIADVNKDFVDISETGNDTTLKSTKTKLDTIVDDTKQKQGPVPYERKNKVDFPVEEDLPFDIEETPRKETTQEVIKNNEGVTTKITFMSGATVSKNNGNIFYKFECTEERIITPDMNVQDEREKLWATINAEIDKQIEDIMSN